MKKIKKKIGFDEFTMLKIFNEPTKIDMVRLKIFSFTKVLSFRSVFLNKDET